MNNIAVAFLGSRLVQYSDIRAAAAFLSIARLIIVGANSYPRNSPSNVHVKFIYCLVIISTHHQRIRNPGVALDARPNANHAVIDTDWLMMQSSLMIEFVITQFASFDPGRKRVCV